MNRKAFLSGALFGFIYSLIGYGGFLAWNYYDISTPTNYMSIIVGLFGLPIAILFIPGSYILQLLKDIGFPVFTTFVPFPYYDPIPVIGIVLGSIILTLLGGLLGVVIFIAIRSFKSKKVQQNRF